MNTNRQNSDTDCFEGLSTGKKGHIEKMKKREIEKKINKTTKEIKLKRAFESILY